MAKQKKKNSDRPYTDEEVNTIVNFIWRKDSLSTVTLLAYVYGREISSIEKVFQRVCLSATDYSDKKIYKLKYLSNRFDEPLTGAGKEYIRCQWSVVTIKPKKTIQKLSREMGVSEDKIKKFIKRNEKHWKKNPKQSLFKI